MYLALKGGKKKHIPVLNTETGDIVEYQYKAFDVNGLLSDLGIHVDNIRVYVDGVVWLRLIPCVEPIYQSFICCSRSLGFMKELGKLYWMGYLYDLYGSNLILVSIQIDGEVLICEVSTGIMRYCVYICNGELREYVTDNRGGNLLLRGVSMSFPTFCRVYCGIM